MVTLHAHRLLNQTQSSIQRRAAATTTTTTTTRLAIPHLLTTALICLQTVSRLRDAQFFLKVADPNRSAAYLDGVCTHLPGLQRLVLTRTFSDANVMPLARLQHLQSLEVRGSYEFTDIGAVSLAATFLQLPLQALSLSNCPMLGDTGARLTTTQSTTNTY